MIFLCCQKEIIVRLNYYENLMSLDAILVLRRTSRESVEIIHLNGLEEEKMRREKHKRQKHRQEQP